jgi:hypothetical protein
MRIEWIENKNPDWKIATISHDGIITSDVSINRVGKTGEVFPDFDSLQSGRDVEGTLWTSSAGKHYLFPEKKPTPGVMGQRPAWAKKGGGVAAAQERKEEMIIKAQDRKEESIAYFNSVNSAIELLRGNLPMETEGDIESLKQNIIYWRDFFYNEWSNFRPEDHSVPFIN